jgi:hypothetical protein
MPVGLLSVLGNSGSLWQLPIIADIVLFEIMLLSQIGRGMLETTLISIDNPTLLFYWLKSLKILRCQLNKLQGVDLDYMPSSQMTRTIFSLHRFSLPLYPNLSLSVSLSVCLSLLSALFPVMFYLPWFPLNTRQFEFCIIIDLNKLIWTTSLFHFEVAHNTISMIF